MNSVGPADVASRWDAYQANERARDRQPMTWGEWLRAGQPCPA